MGPGVFHDERGGQPHGISRFRADGRAKGFEHVTLKVMEGERGEWTVLAVSGEMDLVTSPAVRQHVHEAVADGRRSVVLDLTGVRFCDSSGVGVLISARRLMRSCSGRLRLILPTEEDPAHRSHLNRVLAALGLRRLFDVYPDLPAAIAAPVETDAAGPLSA
jgi:anti-anti-sigma factor